MHLSMVAASGGKEATAKQSKVTDSKVPALDYVDIPHSQIRKVKLLITLTPFVTKF